MYSLDIMIDCTQLMPTFLFFHLLDYSCTYVEFHNTLALLFQVFLAFHHRMSLDKRLRRPTQPLRDSHKNGRAEGWGNPYPFGLTPSGVVGLSSSS